MRSSVVALDVPCMAEAPAAVRDALRKRLGSLGRRLDNTMIVASELVTNAVLHSGCAEDDTLHVEVCGGDDRLRVAVRDPGVLGLDARLRPGSAFGGWGLRIVDELADRWGAERGDDYLVWAEIALSA